MFCAENLSSVHRFAEAEDVFKDLERSEPDLYIVSFERGKNLLNWGKAQAAMGEIQKALTLNPTHANAIAARLGDLAFLDTGAIDDGDKFPRRLSAAFACSQAVARYRVALRRFHV